MAFCAPSVTSLQCNICTCSRLIRFVWCLHSTITRKSAPKILKSCRYIDFIGAIVPVNRLPVFRYKLPEFTGG